jgi:hypothetical protein
MPVGDGSEWLVKGDRLKQKGAAVDEHSDRPRCSRQVLVGRRGHPKFELQIKQTGTGRASRPGKGLKPSIPCANAAFHPALRNLKPVFICSARDFPSSVSRSKGARERLARRQYSITGSPTHVWQVFCQAWAKGRDSR